MTYFLINNTKDVTSNDLSLKYLVREPLTPSVSGKAIVLLHGVGSNEQDLFRFADQLPAEFYVIAPRGPFTLGEGRYAWYQVDFSTGSPVINTEQEAFSRQALKSFINGLRQRYHLDELYIGGFSQGAIMSYTTGLLNPAEVQGVVALSGRLLHEIKPLIQKDDRLQSLKIFIAHGLHDKTLPVQYAREAKAYAESLGAGVSYHEYELAHQVNTQVLEDISAWLR